ncbi:MAG TPA: hypothetical protein VF263_09360 [Longimicrobiaceae bacterium]
MRPLSKPAPATLPLGTADSWLPVQRLESALIDTVGSYCAFCEMSIVSGGAVQSKRTGPLQQTPRDLDAWDDLLPVCCYCYAQRENSAPVSTARYLWPDVDATFTLTATSPFVYALTTVNLVVTSGEAAAPRGTTDVVLVKANPSSPDFARAQATLALYQLNTAGYDDATNTLTLSDSPQSYDQRLDLRTQAWARAQAFLDLLEEGATYGDALTTALMRQATMAAQAQGFWSVWMTAFWARYPDENTIEPLFVLTRTRRNYIITGYQSLEKTPSEPLARGLPGRPKPPPAGGPWTIFTGTAAGRLAYPTP